MKGMSVVHVKLLFHLSMMGRRIRVRLLIGSNMWARHPIQKQGCGRYNLRHTKCAHLLPVFGRDVLPFDFHFSYSLDAFESYYVNKYADHHSHEICF
ncbi:uncharacterized protein LACBIDRAFT_302507 [Laccaria bicolor S238N-H82]|uniref:Predicted protein n=1 Tax=Laccaria bicolor (strain S238N-H82 / ATCC MYA-4686) TaxID=486041 RepID=B0DHT3_LACBS|nr:uncharacterized protein LACBIDRAFT_302507 [Laccaria bicolor S238N-H82]EDR05786.1 predicted protein [Laccaria bicolor S238N-H82]|eukprot:XP_001883462.1 predicted protein [Laccaria bicolor S238N-H82]